MKVKKAPLKVAWLHAVIPSYRMPFLRKLAKRSELEVTCFHGEGKRGHSVASVGPDLPVKSAWIKNYFWPKSGPRVAWQTALGSILKGNFDVVVCSESVHNLTIWMLWSLRRVLGYRFVLIGYGYRPQESSKLMSRLRDNARMLMLNSADAILVYSERGRKACIEAGLKAEKIFVNSNTLDTDMLTEIGQQIGSQDLKTLQSNHNLNNKAVLLFVGRLLPVKRLDVLLDAVRQLNGREVHCQLLIVGDGHERSALVERAKGLENVSFLGAIYDEEELARYFLAADLLVIPGRVGLTCVHGFVYGLPVLTSQQGVEQSPEFDYITHGENGLLLDNPDPIQYAQTLQNLLQDEVRLARLKSGAQLTARSLGMDRMVNQFVSAIRYAATLGDTEQPKPVARN